MVGEAVIWTFFQDRKDSWLKKNIKPSMDEGEIKKAQAECDQVFSPEEWLPNAAKRAGQISISTHPCTFSHPSSRKNKNGYASSIIANSEARNDGFLRSGNVEVEKDALGNAAALDVYKFLTLKMDDGRSLLAHLEADSDLAKSFFDIKTLSYEKLKAGFLAMVQSNADVVTSSKIKQVYFPVEGGYHQLSLLTPSGIVFDLRQRLDALRFGDSVKEARNGKKKGEYYEQICCENTDSTNSGYREIYGLTTIGYGGTKPQNISVLNNQNGGKAHLLMSVPPVLKKRDIHFPKSDFFTQSIRYIECKDVFLTLHKLYLIDKNNMHIRADRDDYYLEIFDRIVKRMWEVRAVSKDQFNDDYSALNKDQKMWLLDENEANRDKDDDWLDAIAGKTTHFIFHGYEKMLHKKAFKFSDAEYKHIENLVSANKEGLR